MNTKSSKSAGTELRPRAVLAVGITGHREIGVTGAKAQSLAAAFDDIFRQLHSATNIVAPNNIELFSSEPAMMRVICMAADGADILGAHAAHAQGAELAIVLPYNLQEYRKDFTSPPSADMFEAVLEKATTHLELPGSREEGASAYQRANDVILSNIDLLIAVWDGKRARGQGGTGDVVQSAVSRSIPIIVIDPDQPKSIRHIEPSPDDSIDRYWSGVPDGRNVEGDLADILKTLIVPQEFANVATQAC